MEDKHLLVPIVFLVMTVLVLVPLVSAAALTTTWNTKAGVTNYTNHTGSFTFNCTTSAHQAINVTVYANKTTGVMNPLQSFANTSVNQLAWTGTVSIQAADDGSNQNLSCKAQNATVTAYSNEKTPSHVRLDSTAPVCNISLEHESIAFKQGMLITYYSSDVTARRTTTLDVNGPGKHATITTTNQNGPIDLKSNDTAYIGDWIVNMTVTDWSGNSCTAGANFSSYLPDGEIEEEVAQPGKNNTLILLVLAGVAIWFFATKKNK